VINRLFLKFNPSNGKATSSTDLQFVFVKLIFNLIPSFTFDNINIVFIFLPITFPVI
jgi:hypothetical protein